MSQVRGVMPSSAFCPREEGTPFPGQPQTGGSSVPAHLCTHVALLGLPMCSCQLPLNSCHLAPWELSSSNPPLPQKMWEQIHILPTASSSDCHSPSWLHWGHVCCALSDPNSTVGSKPQPGSLLKCGFQLCKWIFFFLLQLMATRYSFVSH